MKIVQRNISEVSQQEKVQIHFKFNDLKLGYAQIAREHMLDNGDIYVIVQEIERIRAFRAENPKVKHVLRRVYINKHREVNSKLNAIRVQITNVKQSTALWRWRSRKRVWRKGFICLQ